MSRANGALERIQARYPELLELVRPLSLAVRCEIELVRAMRLRLLPHSDSGLEADLWFGPLVQAADVSAVVLARDVRSALQPRLAERPEELEAAWQVVSRIHERLDAVVLLEERHTYRTLRARYLRLHSPSEARAEEELALHEIGTVLRALHDNPNDRDLLRWIARFLPRLPDDTAGSEAAIILKRDAQRLLPSIDAPAILSVNAPSTMPERLFETLPRVELGVRRVERGVWLTRPAQPGAHRIEAPLTEPIRLEVSWPTAEGWAKEFAGLEDDALPQMVATPIGQLPSSWRGRSRSRVANALLLTAPGIPVIFMGQEILESRYSPVHPTHSRSETATDRAA